MIYLRKKIKSSIKLTSLIPLLATFFIISTSSSLSHGADVEFSYIDEKCVNAAGEEGYNNRYLGQCSNLSGATIGGLDLSGIDFSGSKMQSSDFQGSIFNEANFEGVDLEGANLSGVSANGAVFKNANLSAIQLLNAKLGSAVFENSNLTNVNFSKADLSFSQFTKINLAGAKWSEANLSEVEIRDCDLSEAQLTGANMKGAQLDNVIMNGASLTGANLLKAKLSNVRGQKINMSNVSGRGMSFELSDFSEGIFTGGRFDQSSLSDVNFSAASLQSAVFSNATFTKTVFKETNLRGTQLEASTFTDSIFTGAIFSKSTTLPFDADQAAALGMIFLRLSGIGLFNNQSYVDWRPGNKDSEGANMDAQLNKREDYHTFEAIEGDKFSAILETKSIVVIPELEVTRLELSEESSQALKAYVEDGGRLVIAGSNGNTPAFLNSVFGFSTEGNGNSDGRNFSRVNAKGSTLFKNAPLETLRGPDANYALVNSSLPENSVLVYANDNTVAVAEIPYGTGSIIFISFDWYDAAPVGSIDGGWLGILDMAVVE